MSKRSRVGTASNLSGDTDVINYVSQPKWQHCSESIPAPAIEAGSELGGEARRVFTLGSPERGDGGGDRVGVFLDECFSCKKRIDHGMEVFMYSERAFCKIVCRQFQILVDTLKERAASVKRKVVD